MLIGLNGRSQPQSQLASFADLRFMGKSAGRERISLKPEGNRINVPRPNTLKAVARAGSPRKPKLGQHFLTSEPAALRIVEALGDVSHSTVLEIGPGRGAITEILAPQTHRLIAVELDRVLSAQ